MTEPWVFNDEALKQLDEFQRRCLNRLLAERLGIPMNWQKLQCYMYLMLLTILHRLQMWMRTPRCLKRSLRRQYLINFGTMIAWLSQKTTMNSRQQLQNGRPKWKRNKQQLQNVHWPTIVRTLFCHQYSLGYPNSAMFIEHTSPNVFWTNKCHVQWIQRLPYPTYIVGDFLPSYGSKSALQGGGYLGVLRPYLSYMSVS